VDAALSAPAVDYDGVDDGHDDSMCGVQGMGGQSVSTPMVITVSLMHVVVFTIES